MKVEVLSSLDGEMVDTRDLKSLSARSAGSIPVRGTTVVYLFYWVKKIVNSIGSPPGCEVGRTFGNVITHNDTFPLRGV